MSIPHIVVVGSLNLDLVARVRTLPVAGETVHSRSLDRYPGGKGANQAVAAARVGARVRMVGNVGEDDAGALLRQALTDSSVDVSMVRAVADAPTGTALITLDQAGENTIVIAQGANGLLAPAELDRAADAIRGAGMVLAQLEVPLETVERLAEMCSVARVPLMLDPAPGRVLPPSLLRQVTWLTPNQSETALLLGMDAGALPWEERAERLLALGCANVVLKLGSSGAYLARRGTERADIRPFAVNAVDSTAAGDVFNGAFAARLCAGTSAGESATYAAAAAAISVTRHGAQPSMPNAAK